MPLFTALEKKVMHWFIFLECVSALSNSKNVEDSMIHHVGDNYIQDYSSFLYPGTVKPLTEHNIILNFA